MFDKILYPYVTPVISLYSNVIREYGPNLSYTFNWSVIKKSYPIQTVVIDGFNILGITGNNQSGTRSVTGTYSYPLPSSTTNTFSIENTASYVPINSQPILNINQVEDLQNQARTKIRIIESFKIHIISINRDITKLNMDLTSARTQYTEARDTVKKAKINVRSNKDNKIAIAELEKATSNLDSAKFLKDEQEHKYKYESKKKEAEKVKINADIIKEEDNLNHINQLLGPNAIRRSDDNTGVSTNDSNSTNSTQTAGVGKSYRKRRRKKTKKCKTKQCKTKQCKTKQCKTKQYHKTKKRRIRH